MKIEVFFTLDAVLRTGSFARAAEACNMTPSAVSMQMRQLEHYVSRPLFDRSGLQVKPLPLAHELADAMRGGLAKMDMLRERAVGAVRGTVKLGIIASMVPALLPTALAVLRSGYPELDVQPSSGRSSTLIAGVKNGEIDCAIVGQSEEIDERLIWTPLEQRELIALAPPRATERTLGALFKKYEWIRHDRSTVTGRMAAQYVERYYGTPKGSLELDTPTSIIAMVSAGFGVSILQLSEVATFRVYPVRVLSLKSAPVLQISLISRVEDERKRSVVALRKALQQAVSSTARDRLQGYPVHTRAQDGAV